MDATIRHTSHHLKLQKSTKKLMLVIPDDKLADIDARDPQYLRHDTKKTVEEANRADVPTYCISLDPRADNVHPHIRRAQPHDCRSYRALARKTASLLCEINTVTSRNNQT